jgi:hypothetical protein
MSKILSAAILLAAALAASPAAAIEYPWCAQYGMSGQGGRNCGFSTYRQCMDTVSGIGGFCERNQFYQGRRRR